VFCRILPNIFHSIISFIIKLSSISFLNGKEYICKGCGNKIDSDLNSAINHEKELPEIPFEIRQRKINMKGFYWKETGIYLYEVGQEYRVPDINSLKKIEL
jgi:hypothetical protein